MRRNSASTRPRKRSRSILLEVPSAYAGRSARSRPPWVGRFTRRAPFPRPDVHSKRRADRTFTSQALEPKNGTNHALVLGRSSVGGLDDEGLHREIRIDVDL